MVNHFQCIASVFMLISTGIAAGSLVAFLVSWLKSENFAGNEDL